MATIAMVTNTMVDHCLVLYGEKFSRDKIFVVFADLPETTKILIAKFYPQRKPHPFPAISVALRLSNREILFAKSLPAANPRKFCAAKIYHHTVFGSCYPPMIVVL